MRGEVDAGETVIDDHETEDAGPRLDALVATWPLVGRDALIDRVLGSFDDGRSGVVLHGPPGVGKSRVAQSIAAIAGRRGAVTEWVRATDATRDLPLGAFAALLPKDAQATPLDLLRRMATSLQARAKRRRLVLVVDDAHLLDPASATLVHQVAASGEIFIVATVRAGEPAPDAVVSLWKDGLTERIDVDVLAEDQVAAVLQGALGDQVEVATAHRLWMATGGNALFLHELAVAGVRSGALHLRGSTWRWRGPLTGDGKLRDVLEARLEPLDASRRAALDLLAVGEPLGVDVFEALAGIDVVDDLERQELIRVRRDERREEASIAHPLYRDLLVSAMGPDAFAALQERLATAVENAGGRRRGDLLRVAMWRVGGPALAKPDLLLGAAAEAESRFDAALAERLARMAVDREGGPAAWQGVASALRAQGRYREADEAWVQALELEPEPAARLVLAQARSANLFFGLGEAARAVEVLDDIIPDATTPASRDAIGALIGLFDLYRGRVDAALATSVPILERGVIHEGPRIDAALTASTAYALRGRATDAIAVVDSNIAIALQNPAVGPIPAGALLATRLLALALDGDLLDALAAARVVYDLAVDMGTHDGVAGLSFALGHVYAALGNVDAALRHLLEGAELLREHDRNGYLPWCLGELAYVQVLAGRMDDAVAACEELDRVERPELRLFQPRVDTARAITRGGSPEEIAADLLAAGQCAVADGHLVLGAMAIHDAVRFGMAADAADALGRLVVSTESRLVHAFAAHARAVASQDPGALDAASHRFEELGALLHAAEAAGAAALAHAAHANNASRAAAEQRRTMLLERCPGAAPPWLAPVDAIEPLSGRQLEVAELAARGIPSKDIAERLFVSVRTVDNHLYRIYAKLGVDSREELALVLALGRGRRAGE